MVAVGYSKYCRDEDSNIAENSWRLRLILLFTEMLRTPSGEPMPNKILLVHILTCFALLGLTTKIAAQSPQPYLHAITDRLLHPETPMSPPPRNVVFTDPDFGSLMVRATDPTTNFKFPGTFLRTAGSGEENEWSVDSRKFYVIGNRVFAYAFDPETMTVSSLPTAVPGQALILPLREGASFSLVDPDLIYGTNNPDTLTITSYRFSTGVSTPVIDTRTCGVQPPLGTGPSVVSDDDVRTSLDDGRFSISEGGKESGQHMFVVVYDKKLGCRWYNTQTGQIGGQWGPKGLASVSSPYLIRHAYLSRNGRYVVILVNYFGWYVWDLTSLNVTACPVNHGPDECAGYLTVGYNTLINGPGKTGDMQIAQRPLGSIGTITQLGLPVAFQWDEVQHYSWNNVNIHDNTPVCGSTYDYEGDPTIDQPFAGEIFCAETDGLADTIWRFAHNRAKWVAPYYQTQPLGSVSRDGHFYMFTSTWDGQLGNQANGTPLSDVFIVKLD